MSSSAHVVQKFRGEKWCESYANDRRVHVCDITRSCAWHAWRMHTEMAACTQARWCVLVRSTNGNGYAYGTGLIKCVRVGGVSASVLSVCANANVVHRIKRILWLCDVCVHECARFVFELGIHVVRTHSERNEMDVML